MLIRGKLRACWQLSVLSAQFSVNLKLFYKYILLIKIRERWERLGSMGSSQGIQSLVFAVIEFGTKVGLWEDVRRQAPVGTWSG